MKDARSFVATEAARLDALVAARLACSRAEARRLIDAGQVRVDGRRGKKGLLVAAGARVELTAGVPTEEQRRPAPEPELPLVVLHQDDALVALAKPAGMPTHPLRAGERGTLANALVARHPECAQASDDPREGGLAHRLDVDTSGVVVAARSREDFRALRRAFAGGRAQKVYLALVAGAPPERGEVDAPLVHATRRTMRAVAASSSSRAKDRGARAAVTRYETIARGANAALVRATTTTGRMHQVRAHLAHAGYPLIGDETYGGPPAAGGHVLHALELTLPHPRTSLQITFVAPLPEARARLIRELTGW